MSTQYASTPVDDLSIEFEEQRQRRAQVRISDWADYHDVYPWLLPLENRVQHPLETASIVKEYLDGLGDLTETFTRKEFGLQHNGDNVTQSILQLFQITEFETGSQRPVRYRNPDYRHYEARTVPITDTDARHEHYQRWKDIPGIDAAWFDHHWGTKSKSSADWIRYHYGNYREQRQHNRERLARTIRTYQIWTGDSIRSVCTHLPFNYNTAKDLVRRFAKEADWQPPERPCSKHWFMAAP